jgi:hypothetical protein
MAWKNVEITSYDLTEIGVYNPLASTVLTLSNFTWAGGSKDTPSDTFVEDHD